MRQGSLKKGIVPAVLLLTFAWGCSKPKSLEFINLQNFNVQSLSTKESVVSADVRFYNPNNFKIKLRKAEMDIAINDQPMGRSVLDTNMAILARDTFLLPVQLRVDLSGLIANSLNLLLSKEVDVKVNGRARLGRAGVFFNFPFSYEGKQKLPLFP